MTLKAIVSIIKTTNGERPVEPISALVNYENQYKNKEKIQALPLLSGILYDISNVLYRRILPFLSLYFYTDFHSLSIIFL